MSYYNDWSKGVPGMLVREDLELRSVKEFVRRRYAENKEFVPAEEVYEIVFGYCKYYREENKRLTDMIIQEIEYNLRYNTRPQMILVPQEKK